MSDGVGSDDERAGAPSAADAADSGDETGDESGGLTDRLGAVTAAHLVVAVTILGLVARLVALDARPAHWDEARVAYWAQYYAETGSLGYHWEEHGPLVQIVSRWLFEVFGVTDTATRIPVAVVGGLLPLAALLYREHLRDAELVALSVFLAGNSVLLYYSRFMRSDVLVATFMFVALGLVVRFLDTRRYRYLYGVGLFVALGFGSKENAVVYLLTWGGATALLVDGWLHSPADDESGRARFYRSWAWDYLRPGLVTVRSVISEPAKIREYRAQGVQFGYAVLNVAGATLVALLTTVFIFADRGGGADARVLGSTGVDENLGDALAQPLAFPGFAYDTLTATREDFGEWFSKSSETTFDTYTNFLDGFLGVLTSNAPVLVAFAVFGFLLERYGRDDPRPLVLFFSYCGVASVVGYPLGTDVTGAWGWVSTHIVVPLAVPAAVGVAWVYRSGRQFYERDDRVGLGVVVAILLVVSLQGGLIVATDVYQEPTADDNELVQFAQAHDDLDPVVANLSAASTAETGDEAVVYYGLKGPDYDENRATVLEDRASPFWDIQPTCTDWSNFQPMNWYFTVADAEGQCLRDPGNLTAALDQNPPPVVIATPDDYTLPEERLDAAYHSETYLLRTIGKEVVVYTHRSQVE